MNGRERFLLWISPNGDNWNMVGFFDSIQEARQAIKEYVAAFEIVQVNSWSEIDDVCGLPKGGQMTNESLIVVDNALCSLQETCTKMADRIEDSLPPLPFQGKVDPTLMYVLQLTKAVRDAVAEIRKVTNERT